MTVKTRTITDGASIRTRFTTPSGKNS